MSVSAQNFDREQSLAELLPKKEAEKLVASLTLLFDAQVAVIAPDGGVIAGAEGLPASCGVDLALELEPIGQLRIASATPVARQAAAALTRQLLTARARYRMASGVHLASVQADFEELARQNAALKASEAKYRELSEVLEARVAAQVKIIDERQRQLYQAERLASVGQLAAGVAHEINNPIGFVRSNLSTAQKYVDKLRAVAPQMQAVPAAAAAWQAADLDFVLGDFVELLDDSIGGVDRVARIVADLKGFSSVDRPEEEVISLDELLAGACNIVLPELPAGARLERNFGGLPPTLCLPGHLSQAFLNLLSNARQAIAACGEQGQIRVETRREGDDQVIVVSDNGAGIPADLQTRVFDPFFTTRPVGKGTGLGLTVARDIVQAHGGEISLESTLGEGTTVRIRIPE